MTKAANRVFEFGEFRLETAERLLLRAGTRIHLTPKAFETLLALVQTSGRVVTKDDLMAQVWPDITVEEANLARNVWALRKAFGDDNGNALYIETIPKLGYRFVAAVRELPIEGDEGALQATAATATLTASEDTRDVRLSPTHDKRTVVRAAVLLVVVSVTLMWASLKFWPWTARASKAEPGLTFLTDGSHDDIGAYWTNSGRIYFSRSVSNTRVETWTMNGDGTNQHRANTEIGTLLAGRWSPDGKRVAFRKDDESQTVYLADADGSNEIALAFAPGNMDWSPDGSHLVYQARTDSGSSEIYLYTVGTSVNVRLRPGIASADPSFSYDGRHIAFTGWTDGNAEIYVVNADGSDLRRLTEHPAFDNYPVFSPDGTQVAFQSNREDEHVEVYLQDLDTRTPPRRLTHSTGLTGLFPKCWSPDGTRMLVYTNRHGNQQIGVIEVEPAAATLVLSDPAADLGFPRVSMDGKRLLHEARLTDHSLELRVLDLETRGRRTVYRTMPGYPVQFHLAPAWSPDDSLIAFSDRVNGNSEIFTIRTDGSDLQNVSQNPLLDSTPVFAPDGREIVFARDAYGQAHLYRMDVTGAHQRRVTDAAGYEMNPAFSPDGGRLVFAADRTSRALDIVLLDLQAPSGERLVARRRFHDSSPVFSPDGRSIAFVATSDGNPEIYVVRDDGTGLYRLTHTREGETDLFFSRDGADILFSSDRSGRFALYRIPAR